MEQSSQDWHKGEHDPWPYINYVLFILKTAYKEFEERVEHVKSPRGAKTELIERAAGGFQGSFTVVDLERACPGVSRDMVRKVLRDLKGKGKNLNAWAGVQALHGRKRGNILKRGQERG